MEILKLCLVLLTIILFILIIKSSIEDSFGWTMMFLACFTFTVSILGILITSEPNKEGEKVEVFKDDKGREYILKQKIDTIYIHKDSL